jgi:hypothetical protein
MAVFDAFPTRYSVAQRPTQELLQGIAHSACSTGHWLDAILLKKTNRASAHAAGEHDIHRLTVNEPRDLAWLMVTVIRIGDGLHRLCLSPAHI